jgi:hypothetical protein
MEIALMMTAIQQMSERHFGRKTVKALAKRGVRIIGTQAIPGEGPMPFANATTGYVVDDNGTGHVLTFSEVMRRVTAA